jgi:hypothetical protein
MIGKALVIWASVPVALSTAAQTTPTVTSKVVTVSNRKYTVYDYADPATKNFCVVIPEGLKTVRGLLVQCNYAGGDSRGDWTFCHYYREFMHLHDFGLVASAGDIRHVKAFQALRDCLQMVSVTSPGPCGPGTPAVDPGANVPITVDASQFPNWKKLEFYDGAKKLGTVTAAPAQFTATNLTPGYHVFSVLGTDAQGNLRTSNPALVVVRRPSTDVHAAQQ